MVVESITGAAVLLTWVVFGRLIYRLTRDLSALAQRLAHLEGRGGLPPPTPPGFEDRP